MATEQQTNQADVNVTDSPLAASAIKDSADEMDIAMSQLTLKDSDSENPASVGIMDQTVNTAADVSASLQIQDAGSMEKLKEQVRIELSKLPEALEGRQDLKAAMTSLYHKNIQEIIASAVLVRAAAVPICRNQVYLNT